MVNNNDNSQSGWDLDPDISFSVRNETAGAIALVADDTAALTKAEEVEQLVKECLDASQEAHTGKFDTDKAQNTAAKFLTSEIKLTFFIGDIELRAKHSKNEIERIEAEKYQNLKANTTAKMTEVALENAIARDTDVIQAKRECAEAEAEAKKWNYLLGVLKDGHIFFRNLGKASNI